LKLLIKVVILGYDTREMKMMKRYNSKRERGPRGIVFMGIYPTHIFLKLLSLCKPSILY